MNEDVIDLGDASDQLWLWGDASQATIWGGPGRDVMTLQLMGWPESRGEPWKIDNQEQAITLGSTLVASYRSFASFTHEGRWRGPLTFVGTRRRETLVAFSRADWPVTAHMGGGRDILAANSGANDSRYDGGSGVDTLRHFLRYDTPAPPNSALALDLASGRLRKTIRGRSTTQMALNFENATLFGSVPATVWGTAGPNRLKRTQSTGITIYGRGGNDHLRGGPPDDILIGGAGRDTANGGRGTDRCEAELSSNCEPQFHRARCCTSRPGGTATARRSETAPRRPNGR
jgi:Ca2+-binding RTX toxin-like protein